MKTNQINKQEMNRDEICELVATQLSDALTADENRRLNEWIGASEANREEYDRLVEVWNSTPDVSELSQYDSKKAFAMFVERIKKADLKAMAEPDVEQPEIKSISIRRYTINFMRYAAVVAVIACACSYLFYNMGQRNMEQAFAMIKVGIFSK